MHRNLSSVPHYVNSYHHSESLLFQFLLAEFLRSCEPLQKIEHIYKQQLNIEECIPQLSKLTGLAKDHTWIFPWSHEDGSLSRLKTYADLTVEILPEETLVRLQKTATILHYYARCAHDKLHFPNNTQACRDVGKILQQTKLLKKWILNSLKCFTHDENVLYFILRHHHDWTLYYGKSPFLRVMKKLYPKGGLVEIKEMLMNAYARRHFQHLLPDIQTRFKEWAAL